MKKIYSFALAVIALVTMAACSTAASSGPGDALKSYYEALIKGDYVKFADGLLLKDTEDPAKQKEEVTALLKEKLANAPSEKKLSGVEVVSEKISEDGNSADVTVKLTMADGSTSEDDQKMVKVDGKWLIDLDK
jgi:uncharacterized protein YchJ